MAAVQAQHVVHHQHLAIAAGAGTNADGGHAERGADLGGDRRGHAFQHDQAGTGVDHGLRVAAQLLAGFAAPLHRVTAKTQHRLRGQPQVRADRDLALDQIADHLELVPGSLDLDHLRAGLQQLGGSVSARSGVASAWNDRSATSNARSSTLATAAVW